jgi:hypothetical protein
VRLILFSLGKFFIKLLFATMFIGGATIAIYAETQQFNTLDLILWLHIALFIWLSIRYSQLMLTAQIQDARVDSEIKVNLNT